MSTLHNKYLNYIINSFNSIYFCLIRVCTIESIPIAKVSQRSIFPLFFVTRGINLPQKFEKTLSMPVFFEPGKDVVYLAHHLARSVDYAVVGTGDFDQGRVYATYF